jgi:flagellar biosynthetic protein FlhB
VAEESFQERTEAATGKRKSEARERGQVARSVDMNSAFMLMFGLMILLAIGEGMMTGFQDLLRTYFKGAGTFHADSDSLRLMVTDVAYRLAFLLGPILGGLAIVALAAGYAQVGLVFSFKALEFSFAKFNPLSGIKRVFISRRSAVELGKNVIKAGVVGFVAYKALNSVIEDSVTLMDGDIRSVFAFMGNSALALGFKAGLAFLAVAVLDYFYQRFEYEHGLKMTKEEIRQEGKELEGDPLVKGRIRSVQRKIAYRRMMQDVPKADVVVTNPTHLAVAIQYKPGKMSAPKVVAKGAGLIAERIKSIARENEIPVLEDKPLARALFAAVDVGDEIPEKLFQAVAQVLAYIYRLRNLRPQLSLN